MAGHSTQQPLNSALVVVGKVLGVGSCSGNVGDAAWRAVVAVAVAVAVVVVVVVVVAVAVVLVAVAVVVVAVAVVLVVVVVVAVVVVAVVVVADVVAVVESIDGVSDGRRRDSPLPQVHYWYFHFYTTYLLVAIMNDSFSYSYYYD